MILILRMMKTDTWIAVWTHVNIAWTAGLCISPLCFVASAVTGCDLLLFLVLEKKNEIVKKKKIGQSQKNKNQP